MHAQPAVPMVRDRPGDADDSEDGEPQGRGGEQCEAHGRTDDLGQGAIGVGLGTASLIGYAARELVKAGGLKS